MKLYLASFGIQKLLGQEFLKLVGKQAEDIKFAYVTNAADPYPFGKRGWMKDVQAMFSDLGLKTEEIDLRQYEKATTLKERLSQYDVVWCGGGNTWYLRYAMKTSGFDQIIRELVEGGIVYGGDSAGAIVATPTLEYVDLLDEPEDAPEQIEKGLSLVEFAIVPHWGNEKYEKPLTQMRDGLVNKGFDVKVLTDQQAIIVNGSSIREV